MYKHKKQPRKLDYFAMLEKFPDAHLGHGWTLDEKPLYNFVHCLACDVYNDCPDWGDDPKDFYKEVINTKLLQAVDDVITCDECCGCGGW